MKLMLKLTAALAAGICIILVVFGIHRVNSQTAFFRQTMEREHRALGRALGISIAEVWTLDGQARALQLVDTISAQSDSVNLRWVWFNDDTSDYYRPVAPLALLAGATHGKHVTWVDAGGPDRSGRLFTYVSLPVRSVHPGGLELWTSLAPLEEQVQDAVLAISGATLGLLGLAVMLALVLGYWLVGRPVQRLVGHARRIGSGDFSPEPVASGKDELSELARALNNMCAQLAEAIDARIAALERLRHADRLATVGQLASGVAHELGTPLGTVALRAQYVELDEQAPQDVRDNGRVIREQCRRMDIIIRQLLDFSRPRPSERHSVELRGLLERTIGMLEPMAKKYRARLRCDCTDRALRASLDTTQMQQVLSNLLVNAMQAMPEGGEIRVGAEPFAGKPLPDYEGDAEGFVSVYVSDTGHGIDAQTRNRLFEPFFTTKDVGKGTGLGLAVAYGIVREHAGWIDVFSERGQGSTFSVVLPADGSPQQQRGGAGPRGADHRGVYTEPEGGCVPEGV